MSDWKPDEGMMLEVIQDPEKGPSITMHVSDSFRRRCGISLLEAYNYLAPYLGLPTREFDSEDLDCRSAILDETKAATIARLARDVGAERAEFLEMELSGHWITTGFPSDQYTREFLARKGVRLAEANLKNK